MKKFFKAFLVMLLAVLSITLVSCSGDESNGEYLGRYEITKMEMGGEDVTDMAAGEGTFLELKENGVAVAGAADYSVEGTYTIDGDKISITIEGETINATLSDGKIIVEMEVEGYTQYIEYGKVETEEPEGDSNVDSTSLIGTWNCTKYDSGGYDMVQNGYYIKFVFTETNVTYIVGITDQDYEESYVGTYTLDGTDLTIDVLNKPQVLQFADGKITKVTQGEVLFQAEFVKVE